MRKASLLAAGNQKRATSTRSTKRAFENTAEVDRLGSKPTNAGKLDVPSGLISNVVHLEEIKWGGKTYVQRLFNRAHSSAGQRGL